MQPTSRSSLGTLVRPALVIAVLVLGAIAAAQQQRAFESRVAIAEHDGVRTIRSNGIPNHVMGEFPNRGNPNTVSEQKYEFHVTMTPRVADRITPLRGNLFGVAINGVPFDPGTAEIWTPNGRGRMGPGAGPPDELWNYDALSGKINLGLDANNAHVQPTGAYHYHGLPTGLIASLREGQRMTLVGYAADGFPIYARYGYVDPNNPNSGTREMQSSYRLKHGQRPGGDKAPGGAYDGTYVQDFEYVKGLGDLDECNGRVGVTPEYPKGIYHYYLTRTYPFVPRFFRGTPDPSFRHGPPAGGPGGERRGPGPGPGGPGGFGPPDGPPPLR
ncbi:MAG: YHYH protein [Planctomycetes bacterium]|nr:YHYH protein [Planctomycetota bacterium]